MFEVQFCKKKTLAQNYVEIDESSVVTVGKNYEQMFSGRHSLLNKGDS